MSNRERELLRSQYLDAYIVYSEAFSNVAYEAVPGAIRVMQWVDGRRHTLAGSLEDMLAIAEELADICRNQIDIDIERGVKLNGK